MLQDCTRNKGNFSLADGNEGEPESSKREVVEENSQSAYQNNVPRQAENANFANSTAVASMRRTEALASVKFYQILSIFIFFIRLIILEDFIRLISYNGPCVRLGCSFFLATALNSMNLDLHTSVIDLDVVRMWFI